MSLINKMLADLETRAAETQGVDDGKPLIDGLKAANEDNHGVPRGRRKWWAMGVAAALMLGLVQWWPVIKMRYDLYRVDLKLNRMLDTGDPHSDAVVTTNDATPSNATPQSDVTTGAAEYVPVPQTTEEPPRVAGLVEFLEEGVGSDDTFGIAMDAGQTAAAQPKQKTAVDASTATKPSPKPARRPAPTETVGVSPQVLADAEIRVHNMSPPSTQTPAIPPPSVEMTQATVATSAENPAVVTAQTAGRAPKVDPIPAPSHDTKPENRSKTDTPTPPVAEERRVATEGANALAKDVAPTVSRAPAPEITIAQPDLPRNEMKTPLPAPKPVAVVAAPPSVATVAPPVSATVTARPSPLKESLTSANEEAANRAHERARQLAADGRFVEAEAQWRDALQRNPNHVEARTQLAMYLAGHQRALEAQNVLEEGVAVAPGQLSWRLLLARIYVDHGATERAAGVLERGQAAGHSSADYWGLRAAIANQLGRPTEAAAAFDQATRLRPEEGRWWMGLAIAREAVGEHATAIDAYEHALRAERFPPELVSYAQRRLTVLRELKKQAPH